MPDKLQRIATARALPGFRLAFTLKGERGETIVDLTGLVHLSKPLAELRDEVRFQDVSVVDWGAGVAWSPEDDPERLDLSLDTLQRIARHQRPMAGAEFRDWRQRMSISLAETAVVLDVAPRTVADYQASPQVPTLVAIACREMEGDRHLLFARFRPSGPVGRPRTSAARLVAAYHDPDAEDDDRLPHGPRVPAGLLTVARAAGRHAAMKASKTSGRDRRIGASKDHVHDKMSRGESGSAKHGSRVDSGAKRSARRK